MKKAEREKKKLELEAEFAGVFGEIERKRGDLKSLEDNITNMEAMRQRKDREFQRLQRNLTELLAEQKAELDALRQKGVELETATATSAAAAAATAAQAKEAEKRTQAMFQSTEELLKFQFMSMSLSYFSSLNMLGNLRDINADTTASAIKSTADAAAASAAAAAAANIPSLKAMNMGASEILDAATMRRRMDEAEKVRKIEEAKKALAQPFDEDVTRWNIHDVCRWLETLTLGQYRRAFEEAAVDGEFLMELRAEDLSDVLGVEHKLHVKKILAARDKLRPLSEEELKRKNQVQWEKKAAGAIQATGWCVSSFGSCDSQCVCVCVGRVVNNQLLVARRWWMPQARSTWSRPDRRIHRPCSPWCATTESSACARPWMRASTWARRMTMVTRCCLWRRKM